MKTFFGNFAGSNQETREIQKQNGIFHSNMTLESRTRARGGRRRDFMQERLAAQERERRIREAENQRIQQLNEQINRSDKRIVSLNETIVSLQEENAVEHAELIENLEMQARQLRASIFSMGEQINRIHMTRAEREQSAIERELLRQQHEMEERMRERERIAQENRRENKTEEELEEEVERSKIRNITAMGARMDNINALSRTRASLSAEAARLRGEADFDIRRTRIANEQIISHVRQFNMEAALTRKETVADSIERGLPIPTMPTGSMEVGFLFSGNPLSADTFRGRHLQNLNTGISRLSATINQQVGALYRDSQRMQNEQLRIYRERAAVPDENRDDEREEYENNSIDLRL